MLRDPKHDTGYKRSTEWIQRLVHEADPKFDLAHFVVWLKTKNPNETYEWDGEACCFGQYEQATGRENTHQTRHYYDISLTRPHTFGAALQRAEACR